MKTKNTVCYVKEDIHRQIKSSAARNGLKVWQVVDALLRKALRKETK